MSCESVENPILLIRKIHLACGIGDIDTGERYTACSVCRREVVPFQPVCSHCGQRIKWEWKI